MNPRLYTYQGDFKLIDYKGRVLSIWLWQLYHRQCSSEGFVALFYLNLSALRFISRKNIGLNSGGNDKL